jgi:hypothetical protein
MRKSILVFVAVAFATFSFAQKEKKEKNETIEGNGKTVTRDVTVSSFDILKAKGVYELKIAQGDKESVKIEADENLQQYFEVKNEGSQLTINMNLDGKSLKTEKSLKVYVTFKKLKEMDLKIVGNVNSEEQLSFDDLSLKNKSVGNVDLDMNVKKLDLQNKSVGNLKLSGKAQEAVVKHDGVGNLKAGSFVVQTMDIDNTGVGNAEVNAAKTLKVKDSFLGKVSNRGSAEMKKKNKVRV